MSPRSPSMQSRPFCVKRLRSPGRFARLNSEWVGWLVNQMGVKLDWDRTRKKLSMYRMRFVPARPADHFLTETAENEVRAAIESDLPRFLPAAIYREHQKDKFRPMLETLRQLTVELQDQGMQNEALADRD